MKAIVIEWFGGPEVLKPKEVKNLHRTAIRSL